MAILSFQKPESNEIPSKVVKGVMRLAKQLKMKGYKNGGSSSDTDSSDDEGSNDEDGYGSTSDSEDDRTYRHSRKSTKKAKKSYKHSGRKNDNTKKRHHQVEDESIRDEMKQLRVMIQDLMKSQNAPSASMELINARPDPNIIPLDSYALNRTYGGYPQQERYEYAQFNQGQSTNRQPQYSNRRSQGRPPATTEYNRTIGRGQEPARVGPTPFEPSQNSYAAPGGGSPQAQPIIGPNGVLYYPARNSVVCYNCAEEGHIRPHCPKLRPYSQQSMVPQDGSLAPQRTSEPLPPLPPPLPARRSDQAVSVVEIAPTSSAFDGVRVREVSAAEVDEQLMKFVTKVADEDEDDESDGDFSDTEAQVMAGERARRFSDLPPEFDGKEGPASQRQRTGNGGEVNPEIRPIKQPVSKTKRKPIRMMAGRQRFDFVGAFRDAPVLGLNWGSFFDLAPTVKKDICRLLVQERAKGTERGKGPRRGKRVSVDAATQDNLEDGEVHAIATDRDLGNVTNFYTHGTIKTQQGRYSITHILVDAGSVVNLMPIKLLRAIGANLRKANGMVIRTATNALARIAYCADLRITVAGVPCDLRVYALPDEYSPTYPMLLSRRWLQAVKAKGDYSTGRYYITSGRGTKVKIPSDEKYKRMVRETERGHRPRVPIILRDREAGRHQLSVEVEEELELQETQGNRFFERLIQLINEEADEQMKEEEDDGAYQSGTSENSEN